MTERDTLKITIPCFCARKCWLGLSRYQLGGKDRSKCGTKQNFPCSHLSAGLVWALFFFFLFFYQPFPFDNIARCCPTNSLHHTVNGLPQCFLLSALLTGFIAEYQHGTKLQSCHRWRTSFNSGLQLAGKGLWKGGQQVVISPHAISTSRAKHFLKCLKGTHCLCRVWGKGVRQKRLLLGFFPPRLVFPECIFKQTPSPFSSLG